MSTDCLFCRIVAGDEPALRIHEDDTTLVFMDKYPATPGHSLVIPKTHATDLRDIPPVDLAAVSTVAQRVAEASFRSLGCTGVNLLNCCGADAWQTQFHFHMHVIPRYGRNNPGDGLDVPWTRGIEGDWDQMNTISRGISAALE